MKKKIAILGALMLAFMAMAGMSQPGAAGCDCSANTGTSTPIAR